jgi:hypothetical protein
VPVGRVVHDEIDQDPNSAAVGFVNELDETSGGAEAFVDRVK